ncbi:CocE/NonD family hydrolase, partial [Candidatus Neomarinimicrobiota bacterium]
MRDGINLATDLFFPSNADGRYPVILIRTPYNKGLLADYGNYFQNRDYVVAIQDVRGRNASEGDWTPYIHENLDGYDTIEWLAVQEWSSGQIGTMGGSYSGSVQYLTAIEKPPHLVTIIPNITPVIPFENMPYDGGALQLGWAIRWVDIMENAST